MTVWLRQTSHQAREVANQHLVARPGASTVLALTLPLSEPDSIGILPAEDPALGLGSTDAGGAGGGAGRDVEQEDNRRLEPCKQKPRFDVRSDSSGFLVGLQPMLRESLFLPTRWILDDALKHFGRPGAQL
jgi:hypothetical protein